MVVGELVFVCRRKLLNACEKTNPVAGGLLNGKSNHKSSDVFGCANLFSWRLLTNGGDQRALSCGNKIFIFGKPALPPSGAVAQSSMKTLSIVSHRTDTSSMWFYRSVGNLV